MMFLTKNWKWILGAIVVVALIIVIWKFATKDKQPNITIEQAPLPPDVTGGATNSSGASTGSQNPTISGQQIRQITLALHEDMDGWNITGHDMSPYEDLLQGTDQLIVAVYNDFNTLYANEGEGTLREWIDNEGWIYPQSTTIEALTDRFNALNLQ